MNDITQIDGLIASCEEAIRQHELSIQHRRARIQELLNEKYALEKQAKVNAFWETVLGGDELREIFGLALDRMNSVKRIRHNIRCVWFAFNAISAGEPKNEWIKFYSGRIMNGQERAERILSGIMAVIQEDHSKASISLREKAKGFAARYGLTVY